MRVPWRNDPARSTVAELWFISSLTPAWYGTRAKHPCRVARPGKPRPRDRIVYNSSILWSTVPFTVNSTFQRVRLPFLILLPSPFVRLSFTLSLSSMLSPPSPCSVTCVRVRSRLVHACRRAHGSSFGHRRQRVEPYKGVN